VYCSKSEPCRCYCKVMTDLCDCVSRWHLVNLKLKGPNIVPLINKCCIHNFWIHMMLLWFTGKYKSHLYRIWLTCLSHEMHFSHQYSPYVVTTWYWWFSKCFGNFKLSFQIIWRELYENYHYRTDFSFELWMIKVFEVTR
jgi:hypothetical protein